MFRMIIESGIAMCLALAFPLACAALLSILGIALGL